MEERGAKWEGDLDRRIAEMEEVLAQARESQTRYRELLESAELEPGQITEFLRSDRCPPDLREEAAEDRERLMRELEQEAGARAPVRRRPKALRRGMTRI